MPLTALDSNSALIVIDLQKGIMEMPVVHPIKEIVEQSARLACAFRKRGLPVVLAHITGGAPGRTDVVRPQVSRPPDWAEIVPEMERQPNDHVVTRQRVGAFLGTDLDQYLRGRGVTQVFLAGVATSAGVEATARSAYDLSYNVVLVVDAMTDRNADTHRHSTETMFPRLGETTTTNEVLGLLGAT